MSRLTNTASAIAVLFVLAAPAFAEADHHKGNGSGGGNATDGQMADNMGGPRMNDVDEGHDMGDHMARMMQMMMSMHSGGGMQMARGMHAGGGTLMGGSSGMGASAMGMMDRDMMQMMRPMMEAGGDGMPATMMHDSMMAHDADSDGSLTLDEFSGWHADMMRETMVDRFQHLDSDGDGKISNDELTRFGGRLGTRAGVDRLDD
ncbi:MAG: hypothetical protein VX791_12955 [Pseudomonadota bacterium]|nr:hypothetical protein [Pseudomonadota bacterium]